jgi:hypothetical protein
MIVAARTRAKNESIQPEGNAADGATRQRTTKQLFVEKEDRRR